MLPLTFPTTLPCNLKDGCSDKEAFGRRFGKTRLILSYLILSTPAPKSVSKGLIMIMIFLLISESMGG